MTRRRGASDVVGDRPPEWGWPPRPRWRELRPWRWRRAPDAVADEPAFTGTSTAEARSRRWIRPPDAAADEPALTGEQRLSGPTTGRPWQPGPPGRPAVDHTAQTAREALADEPALRWRSDLPQPDTGRLYERWLATIPLRQWGAVGLAAVVSGPFAILAALWQNSTTGFLFLLVVVALGPLIEESVKAAGALFLAELKPWLVPAAVVLPVVTLLSGLVFAALENVWFLVILIEDPSPELVRWRWILGPIVHGTASLIVGLGAARMWRRALGRGRSDFGDAVPFLVVAAVLHGAFNAVAVSLSLAGVGPDG